MTDTALPPKQGEVFVSVGNIRITDAENPHKRLSLKEGDTVWITTSILFFREHNLVKIQRTGQGHISTGYNLSLDQLYQFFELQDD